MRLHSTHSLIAILAGAAALSVIGAADAVAAPRGFAMMRGPSVKSVAAVPRKFAVPNRQFMPNLSKLPKSNLMVRTPRNQIGPGRIANNPNGPVIGKPPGDRNPNGPMTPGGRPRPGGPGLGPVVIGTGVAIGTGVVMGTPGPAAAMPPPGSFAPPPGGFNPPGGPNGPRGPQNGINIPPPNENRFVKNEVVLEFSGNYSVAAVQQLLARHRLVRLEQQNLALSNTTYLRVRITDGRPVRTVLRALGNEVTLRSGQPNYLFEASEKTSVGRLPQLEPAPGSVARPPVPQPAAVTPALPQLELPSGLVPPATPAAAAAATLPTKGDPAQYALAKLRLEEAHRLALGTNVLVAVIDSGIDINHPELDGVIAQSYDALDTAEKPHKHGTAIAGAIAAHSRLLGVAPSARILAIQAFGATRANAEATTFAILKGLDHAASQGARVINMSFAGPFDPGLGRQLAAARAKGAVLIAASGNFGPKSPPQYPAADANVIAVTATDADDNLFKAANRGNHVALAAPGVDILLPAPEGGYWMASGTSFAAAHVSGIAALILSRQPDLTPDAVQQILLATARDLGAPGRDPQFGVGLADAYRAVIAVESRPFGIPTAASDANAAAR